MSLAEELEEGPANPVSICRVQVELERMAPEDRVAFERALDNKKWTYDALLEKLAKYGYELTLWQVKNHRQRKCACYRVRPVR